MTKIEIKKYFTYLDALRNSGVTNMFNAIPYVQYRFRVPHSQGKQILKLWILTFDHYDSIHNRAQKALKEINS